MLGLLVLLGNYLGDDVLAFLILCLFWTVELFLITCARTTLSIVFLPKVFFLYFAVSAAESHLLTAHKLRLSVQIFAFYVTAYPHGYTRLAFITLAMFSQHAMFMFWRRYEVPALERCGVLQSMERRSLTGSLSAAQFQQLIHATFRDPL